MSIITIVRWNQFVIMAIGMRVLESWCESVPNTSENKSKNGTNNTPSLNNDNGE